MYLSIFYGWDNSFKIPSYASAGADGYFMNNYTYPKNDNSIPDETASDADLINRARLSISVSKFLRDYPDKPLVVEFGFHTLEDVYKRQGAVSVVMMAVPILTFILSQSQVIETMSTSGMKE